MSTSKNKTKYIIIISLAALSFINIVSHLIIVSLSVTAPLNSEITLTNEDGDASGGFAIYCALLWCLFALLLIHHACSSVMDLSVTGRVSMLPHCLVRACHFVFEIVFCSVMFGGVSGIVEGLVIAITNEQDFEMPYTSGWVFFRSVPLMLGVIGFVLRIVLIVFVVGNVEKEK